MLVDKSAHIDYLRPRLSDLHAEFFISDDEINHIINTLKTEKSLVREYTVDLIDDKGKSVCRIRKSIYIRKAPQKK